MNLFFMVTRGMLILLNSLGVPAGPYLIEVPRGVILASSKTVKLFNNDLMIQSSLDPENPFHKSESVKRIKYLAHREFIVTKSQNSILWK